MSPEVLADILTALSGAGAQSARVSLRFALERWRAEQGRSITVRLAGADEAVGRAARELADELGIVADVHMDGDGLTVSFSTSSPETQVDEPLPKRDLVAHALARHFAGTCPESWWEAAVAELDALTARVPDAPAPDSGVKDLKRYLERVAAYEQALRALEMLSSAPPVRPAGGAGRSKG